MPPKKLWKVFTNKIIKLNRLNKSKPTNKKKKHIFPSQKPPKKKLTWSSLSIQPKKFKPKTKPLHLHKRPPPVYVDQLFIEPVSVLKEQRKLPLEHGTIEEPCSSSGTKKIEKSDKRALMDETTSGVHEADELWENMGSQHGIDQRAEEFIARFRAEMSQELSAHRHRRL